MTNLWRETIVAQYLIRTKYTGSAFKGMLTQPSDRSEAIKGMFKALGLNVQSVLYSVSTAEVMILCEGTHDPMKTAAAEMVVMASGTASDVQVLEVIDAATMTEAMKFGGQLAGLYKPA